MTYFNEVERFCAWRRTNYLDLNVKKTKELLIDFRKNHVPVPDLVIGGVKVERVNEYKYLGAVLDEKLNFTAKTYPQEVPIKNILFTKIEES